MNSSNRFVHQNKQPTNIIAPVYIWKVDDDLLASLCEDLEKEFNMLIRVTKIIRIFSHRWHLILI